MMLLYMSRCGTWHSGQRFRLLVAYMLQKHISSPQPYAISKRNQGKATKSIWYYDVSDVKVTKKKPLTLSRFHEFFQLIPDLWDSDRSWTAARSEIKATNYDLMAVNPHRTGRGDIRTPQELLATIEARGRKIDEALVSLRKLL